jgi:hypothetical protein
VRTDEQELREVEATVAVLITEELGAQHELGAHAVPVPECATCRAHAPRRDLRRSA